MCREEANVSRRARRKTALRSYLISLFCGTLIGVTIPAGGSASQANTPSSVRTAISIPESAFAFELKEISAFDVPETVRRRFSFSVRSECQTEPDEAGGQYPAFRSDRPLYGSFQVGGVSAEPKTGYHYRFAVDESGGPGQGYDRMYIDTNLNGDLTDDPCRRATENVPEEALATSSSLTAQVCFEPVTLRVTPEDDPHHRLEVMPRFFAYKGDRRYAALMTTKAHTGVIRIGWKKFNAVLGHSQGIPGWFNHPGTGLYLLPAGQPNDSPSVTWYGGGQLRALHRSLGTYYRLSATPSGDKLFV